MLSHIITENSITVMLKGKPFIIDRTHTNFSKVEECIKQGCSEEAVLELANTKKIIQKFIDKPSYNNSLVQIVDGEIKYNGEVVNSSLSRRIISLMEKGFDISPFTRFMENLYKNPSYRAVNELYGFLEACNLPITEDGHFLAYKKIREDYKDCYSGKFDNSIGSICEMDRNKVNEDCQQTCSSGLHVASYGYMKSYSGARIVICKINPADVVAVPVDYNNSKMRVCRYEVVNEVSLDGEEIEEDCISDDDTYHEDYGCPEEPLYNETESGVVTDYSTSKSVRESLESSVEIKEDGAFYTKNVSSDVKEKDEALKKIEEVLSEYDANKWFKVKSYLLDNNLMSLKGILEVSWELKDAKALTNKIGNIKSTKVILEILSTLN